MLELILGVIGTILYPMFAIVFLCIDGVQAIFEAFAGIGTIQMKQIGSYGFRYQQVTSGNSGDVNDTGILYYLLQSQIVKNLFISILILAIFLIIIFTAMAFIKNIYQPKQKSWQDIVGSALKGLANFVFIPVACLLGVWLGNILLRAINGATSVTGATSMSNKLFISAAYNANRYRLYGVTDDGDAAAQAYVYAGLINDKSEFEKADSSLTEDQRAEYYAEAVDYAFSQDTAAIKWQMYGEIGGPMGFYSTPRINFLVLIVGGIFMLYVLGSLAFGMVRRLFILLTLFVISPALCAMYPLDDGNAVKSWKSSFIKETISAYSAIAGMNIFFSIVPLLNQISINIGSIPSDYLLGLVDAFLHLFLYVAGLFVVKELISTIAGFIGANDAFSSGSGLMKSTTGEIKKRAKPVLSGAFKYGDIARKNFSDVYNNTSGNRLKKGITAFAKGSLLNVRDMGKQGAEDALNAINKSTADSLGLKAKDIHFDELKGKGFTEGLGDVLKNTGMGQLRKEIDDAEEERRIKNKNIKEYNDEKKKLSSGSTNAELQEFVEHAQELGMESAKIYKDIAKQVLGDDTQGSAIQKRLREFNKAQQEMERLEEAETTMKQAEAEKQDRQIAYDLALSANPMSDSNIASTIAGQRSRLTTAEQSEFDTRLAAAKTTDGIWQKIDDTGISGTLKMSIDRLNATIGTSGEAMQKTAEALSERNKAESTIQGTIKSIEKQAESLEKAFKDDPRFSTARGTYGTTHDVTQLITDLTNALKTK